MRYGEAGQSHLLPFLGAAALFAALTITAHSVVLGLAAVIAGPVPAAQTALSLSRKAVSGAAQEEAASVAEAAPESTGTAASQPEAAAPTGGIESYLVELLGDDARPEGAGAVIEKNYPQGSGEKYVACGAGSIKNNTRQTAADIAAEIQDPLPFGVEKDSPDPQILIMHTHATEDYRLSAGLWFAPGDGARERQEYGGKTVVFAVEDGHWFISWIRASRRMLSGLTSERRRSSFPGSGTPSGRSTTWNGLRSIWVPTMQSVGTPGSRTVRRASGE